MIVLVLFRLILIVFGAWFIITQVIIPSYKGTKLFPMFNKTRAEIEKQKTEIHEMQEIANLKKEINEMKKQNPEADPKPDNVDTQSGDQTK